jgi:hypothetical protein
VRVTMISPGFIETSGAQGMIADIVRNTGASEAAARQQIVDVGRHPGRAARPAGGGAASRSVIVCIDYLSAWSESTHEIAMGGLQSEDQTMASSRKPTHDI